MTNNEVGLVVDAIADLENAVCSLVVVGLNAEADEARALSERLTARIAGVVEANLQSLNAPVPPPTQTE